MPLHFDSESGSMELSQLIPTNNGIGFVGASSRQATRYTVIFRRVGRVEYRWMVGAKKVNNPTKIVSLTTELNNIISICRHSR